MSKDAQTTKIMCTYNNKGGVGKTTTTKYLAKYLANNDKKVLLVDLDPQGNLSSQFLVSNDTEELRKVKNTKNLLLDNTSINCLISSTKENNIDIIYSYIRLQEANNEMLLKSMEVNPATRLKAKIDGLGSHYDYILIDCPPTMDLLITNALAAATDVIIPINADLYSVDGIDMLLEKIEQIKISYNNNLKISKIFMNQFKNTNIHKSMLETCKSFLPNMSENTIGDYTIVKTDTVSNDTKIDNHKIMSQYNLLFEEVVGE